MIDERKYQIISKKKHELPNHAQNGTRTSVVNGNPFQWEAIHNIRLREPGEKKNCP